MYLRSIAIVLSGTVLSEIVLSGIILLGFVLSAGLFSPTLHASDEGVWLFASCRPLANDKRVADYWLSPIIRQTRLNVRQAKQQILENNRQAHQELSVDGCQLFFANSKAQSQKIRERQAWMFQSFGLRPKAQI